MNEYPSSLSRSHQDSTRSVSANGTSVVDVVEQKKLRTSRERGLPLLHGILLLTEKHSALAEKVLPPEIPTCALRRRD